MYALHKLGYQTGVDLDKLVEAGNWLCSTIGVKNESRVGRALWARKLARRRRPRSQWSGQPSLHSNSYEIQLETYVRCNMLRLGNERRAPQAGVHDQPA